VKGAKKLKGGVEHKTSKEKDKIVEKENIQKFYNILKQNRQSESITECTIISQCSHLPREERSDELIMLIDQFLKG